MNNCDNTRFWVETIKDIANRSSQVQGDDFDRIRLYCENILSEVNGEIQSYTTRGAGID